MGLSGGGWMLLAKSDIDATVAERDMFRFGKMKDYGEDGFGHPDNREAGVYWAPLSWWKTLTDTYPQNVIALVDTVYSKPLDAPSSRKVPPSSG